MTRKMVRVGRVPVLPIVAIAALMMSPYASRPVAAAASGSCVTAQVDGPFRLPDGVVRPAGLLTLCDTKTFSPVADQHVILVDGGSVGMFLGSRRTTEAAGRISPEVVFERNAEGYLDLVGYTLPASGRSIAYRLRGRSASWPSAARDANPAGPAAPVAAIIAAGIR